MAKKPRASRHNGRFGTPRHNGREFDVSKADHIDEARTQLNRYWTWNDDGFVASELAYYEQQFGEALYRQNVKHLQQGHRKRLRTMDEWMKARQYRPEETILQVGSVANPVPEEVAMKILEEQFAFELDWSERHGRPYQMLSYAEHWDEATLHGQTRKVWQWVDKDGVWHVGQNKALEMAGVPLPDPTQPEGPTNNRKMTYDAMCREHFLNLCEQYGVQVERVPIKGKGHVSKETYIAGREYLKQVEQEAAGIKAGLAREVTRQEAAISALEGRQTALEARTEKYKARLEQPLAEDDKLVLDEIRRWKGKAGGSLYDEALKAAKQREADEAAKQIAEAERIAEENARLQRLQRMAMQTAKARQRHLSERRATSFLEQQQDETQFGQ